MKILSIVLSIVVFLLGIWNIFGGIKMIHDGFTIIGILILIIQSVVFYASLYNPIKKLLKEGKKHDDLVSK